MADGAVRAAQRCTRLAGTASPTEKEEVKRAFSACSRSWSVGRPRIAVSDFCVVRSKATRGPIRLRPRQAASHSQSSPKSEHRILCFPYSRLFACFAG